MHYVESKSSSDLTVTICLSDNQLNTYIYTQVQELIDADAFTHTDTN